LTRTHRLNKGLVVRAGESDAPTSTSEVTEAPATEGDDFEAKIAALKRKGGGKKAKARKEAQLTATSASKKSNKRGLTQLPVEDLEGEVEYRACRPSVGDLVANIALASTLIWIPLSLAAVGRFSWVRYRFTNKRVTVKSDPPVGDKERTDIAYEDITDVITVGNVFWGDLLLTLKNGDKVEMRSLDNFVELKEYIKERVTEATVDRKKSDLSSQGF